MRDEQAHRTAGGPVAPWHRLRVVLALLLLAAAVLKCQQLATSPVEGIGLLSSRWMLIAVVEFELFFGVWLLVGLWSKQTWRMTVGMFALFGFIGLFTAFSGATTCGCFGTLSGTPWFTVVLDSVVVLCLLRWRPESTQRLSGLKRRLAVLCVVWATVATASLTAMGVYSPSHLSKNGNILGNSPVVALEPHEWIGKRLPLLSYCDISHDLSRGLWIVLLYNHSCSACRETLAEHEDAVEQLRRTANFPKMAVLDLPPYDVTLGAKKRESWRYGRLTNTRQWSSSGPIVVLLHEGVVKHLFANPRDTSLIKAIWGTVTDANAQGVHERD